MKALSDFGRLVKKWWMRFAHALGWVNTRILLSVFYLVILAIPALVLRLLGKDPLRRKFSPSGSYWLEKPRVEHSLEKARRQF